jgi:putative oxidoreductase
MAGLAETGGGLLLALGLLMPAAAALVFSVMLVAAVTVHIKKGFFAQNGGKIFLPRALRCEGMYAPDEKTD